MSWEAVIGIEVHVQLRTGQKLFCGDRAVFGAPPNTHVCPVCLGLPGALPALDPQAVRILVLQGPNTNLFGEREPGVYGTTTFNQINERLHELAAELGIELEVLQSNHEGVLVDALHPLCDKGPQSDPRYK